MEHKINEVIVYNDKGKTIQLKVTPTIDNTCKDCFFYGHCNVCSSIRNIIGTCDKIDRTDNTPVIFKQINNKIMKKTIDIYTIMQASEKDRDLCYNFTSFEEANKEFEKLLQMWENVNKVKAKDWTSPAAPYQLKVSRIGNITLYLCKESIEINIEIDSEEPIFDEPKFRSFFSSYNCFSESVKHSPFGILINKENIYLTILDINEYGISVVGDKRKIELISFEDASKLFNYVDGSPFGYII